MAVQFCYAAPIYCKVMDKEKVDKVLKIVLTVFLLAVPSATGIAVWCVPAIDKMPVLVALSATNLFLGLAEVVFLIRSVIFPRNNKKWWLDE